MNSPLIITNLNIELAEYLVFDPEELPSVVELNKESYLRTEFGYGISDFESKPRDYKEEVEINIEFVSFGEKFKPYKTVYFPYIMTYSINQGVVDLKYLDKK